MLKIGDTSKNTITPMVEFGERSASLDWSGNSRPINKFQNNPSLKNLSIRRKRWGMDWELTISVKKANIYAEKTVKPLSDEKGNYYDLISDIIDDYGDRDDVERFLAKECEDDWLILSNKLKYLEKK